MKTQRRPPLKEKDFYVISVIGEDQVGIVSEVTRLLFKQRLNIVDIEQTVILSSPWSFSSSPSDLAFSQANCEEISIDWQRNVG